MTKVFGFFVAALALAPIAAQDAVSIREFRASAVVDASPGATANVSLGDLDSDGDLDIVLAKGRHWQAADRVLINEGQGTFTARNLGSVNDPSYSALAADIDGDRDLDIVVSNDNQPGRVYLNDGRATFTAGPDWGTGKWPTRNAALADLNGDGRVDVIAANRSREPGRRSQVCLNDGSGRFSACIELQVPPATTIVPADFDRDGDVDLAVPNRDGGQSLILHNDGKAGFARTRPFGSNTMAARAAAAADLNADGSIDLVVGDERAGAFLYLNDGNGGFPTALQLKFDTIDPVGAIAIADLNQDRHPDVVMGYAGARGSVLFNDGSGRSYQHVRFGDAEDAVYGLAIGDIDQDGVPDLVAARNNAPSAAFFNRRGPGVDTILASERIASPKSSLQAGRTEQYRLGIWHGLTTHFYGQQWDTEVRLDQLELNRVAGSVLESSQGVGFCEATLVLLEHKPTQTALFRVTGCWAPSALARVTWLDDGRIAWESWDESGAPNQRWTGTLTRRK